MTHRFSKEISIEDDPILIYQMAKVGSRSIVDSLVSEDISCLHVHYFQGIDDYLNKLIDIKEPIPEHFWVSLALLPYIHNKKWRIITMVRDPIGHELSSCFHSHKLLNVDIASYESAVETIIEDKLYRTNFAYPEYWFDREMEATFGVNVFNHPFDKKGGFQIIETERCRVFVCQMERLDDLMSGAISDFVGCDITPARSGVRKDDIYERVKTSTSLPPNVLDRAYSSKYVNHFYTESQVESFRDRWGNV